MSELKYIASKNGLKYKIVRFEAGSEGKRAKINQKAATVDFTVYPAKFEPNLKLTNEEILMFPCVNYPRVFTYLNRSSTF